MAAIIIVTGGKPGGEQDYREGPNRMNDQTGPDYNETDKLQRDLGSMLDEDRSGRSEDRYGGGMSPPPARRISRSMGR